MPIRDFLHNVDQGRGEISLSEIARAMSELTSLANLSALPPLFLDANAGGYQLRLDPSSARTGESLLVQITGGSGPYSWREVDLIDGAPVPNLQGASGTPADNPLYELNGQQNVPAGTLCRVWRTTVDPDTGQQWEFEFDDQGGVADVTYVTNVYDLSVTNLYENYLYVTYGGNTYIYISNGPGSPPTPVPLPPPNKLIQVVTNVCLDIDFVGETFTQQVEYTIFRTSDWSVVDRFCVTNPTSCCPADPDPPPSGCTCDCTECPGGAPEQMEVTVSGVADNACTGSAALNGTFTLQYAEGEAVSACVWRSAPVYAADGPPPELLCGVAAPYWELVRYGSMAAEPRWSLYLKGLPGGIPVWESDDLLADDCLTPPVLQYAEGSGGLEFDWSASEASAAPADPDADCNDCVDGCAPQDCASCSGDTASSWGVAVAGLGGLLAVLNGPWTLEQDTACSWTASRNATDTATLTFSGGSLVLGMTAAGAQVNWALPLAGESLDCCAPQTLTLVATVPANLTAPATVTLTPTCCATPTVPCDEDPEGDKEAETRPQLGNATSRGNGITWDDPSAATGNPDGAYARTDPMNSGTDGPADWLELESPGGAVGSIPDAAPITNIEVQLRGAVEGTGGPQVDIEVDLIVGGSALGSPLTISAFSSTSDADATQSSPPGGWGAGSLTGADVKNPHFGFRVSPTRTSGTDTVYRLDAGKVKITYTCPPPCCGETVLPDTVYGLISASEGCICFDGLVVTMTGSGASRSWQGDQGGTIPPCDDGFERVTLVAECGEDEIWRVSATCVSTQITVEATAESCEPLTLTAAIPWANACCTGTLNVTISDEAP